MHFQPGDIVEGTGHSYRLSQPRGEGANGVVWAAEAGEETVAVKIIPKREHSFLPAREFGGVKAAFDKKLKHDHVIDLRDCFEREHYYAAVMEYAEKSLEDHARATNRLSPEASISYIRQAAVALDYLHNNDILHCDIKPSNLLLVRDVLKVGGFGRCKRVEAGAADDQPMIGAGPYASPEFIAGSSHVNSDQYSLAVTYAYLRIGDAAFHEWDGNTASLLARLDEFEREPVAKALSPKPDDRFATCTAFVQRLDRALAAAPAEPFTPRVHDPGRTVRFGTDGGDLAPGPMPQPDGPRDWQEEVRRALRAEQRWWYGLWIAVAAVGGMAFMGIVLGAVVAPLRLRPAPPADGPTAQQFTELAAAAKQLAESQEARIGTAERNQYTWCIIQAARELDKDKPDPIAAEYLLDGCPTRLRRWEWDFLRSRVAGSPNHEHRYPADAAARKDSKGVGLPGRSAFLSNDELFWNDGNNKIGRMKWAADGKPDPAGTGPWPSPDPKAPGHELEINAIAVSRNPARVVSGGSDKKVICWSAAEQRQEWSFSSNNKKVLGVGTDDAGKVVVSAGEDGTVQRFYQARSVEVVNGTSADGINAVAVSPDGGLIAAADQTGHVTVWAVKSGAPYDRVLHYDHKTEANDVAFSPDGSLLASCDIQGNVVIWETKSLDRSGGGNPTPTATFRHSRLRIAGVAFHPEDSRIAVACYKEDPSKQFNNVELELWDWRANRKYLTIRPVGTPAGQQFKSNGKPKPTFSPDGTRLAVNFGVEDRLIVWDTNPH